MFDEEQEGGVEPPHICPKCGRTTKFGGHCDCEQIFWGERRDSKTSSCIYS